MDERQFILLCVYLLAGLIGLCVGSFLNVVIYRLPNGMRLSHPASHCPRCDYRLKWYDNVPLLSYLILGGRCRSCRDRIPPRYPMVELLNALLWLLSVRLFWEESVIYALTAMAVSSLLIGIFWIDLEHMLIFNRFTVLLALCGLAAMFTDGFTAWYDHLIGAAVGGAVFAALYYGSIAVLKTEGLGFGDVKYAAAAGLLLGWQKFIPAILIASVLGCVCMVAANRIRHADKRTEYPFGPFLALGTLITMFFGNGILTWYLGFVFDLV
ncbi:MAG: prepilin peptidase [Ruminococcaceae bacterium]|nr:prepilin peptidase [Oscillospiraceae bacterium]